MSSTDLMTSEIFILNSTTPSTTIVQPWFIPLDILMLVCALIVILLAIIYLLAILLDKRCHTVSIMLIANSCLAELIFACDICAMALFSLQNDIQQSQHVDALCPFRSYWSYAANALQNYSYLLSSIYRYMSIVYPTRLIWQSKRTQICLMILTWIIAFAFCFPYLFTGDIVYDVDNQMCQVPLRFSFAIVYGAQCAYIIPQMMIIFIYLKLVRYVKGMGTRVVPFNTLVRVRRDLTMVRRTVLLVMTVTAIGFPYFIIIFLAFFNHAPKYHFRIGYVSTNISMVFAMVALFLITDPLKTSIMKRLKRRPNVVVVARVA